MKIGPKYKIARRLGAPVFEKTQTQKFAVRSEKKKREKGQPRTEFGLQLNEKQKARFFYGITEKQFSNYVKKALTQKGSPVKNLLQLLESRLDNIIYRSQIITTHRGARQAVAHGHFLVNGKRVFVPSFSVGKDDTISIREGSKNSKLFTNIEERLANTSVPAWINFDIKSKELKIKDGVAIDGENLLFDLSKVIEYYQR